MAVQSWALVTLPEAKAYLDVTESGKDLRIEQIINAATRFAEQETGRRLKTRSYTDEVYDGPGGVALTIREYPVTAVTSISFLTGLSTWTAQDTTAFPVTITGPVSNILLYRNNAFPLGIANVKATYTAGLTTVTDELKEAVLQACAFLWKKADRIQTGIASQSFQGQTTTYINDIRQAVDLSLLDPYRRYVC